MTQNDTHIFFWNGIYSNWYWADLTYKGHHFSNSEQAYMWEKAIYFGDTEIAEQILVTPEPKQNKRLGRKIKNFDSDEWLKVSYDFMYDVCEAKFTQNTHLMRQLQSTSPKTLVEASPYDKIWGIGFDERQALTTPENQWGLNLLGKVLTELRENYN